MYDVEFDWMDTFPHPKHSDLSKIYSYPLNDIFREPDKKIRKEALFYYREALSSLTQNSSIKDLIEEMKGASIEAIYQEIYKNTNENGEIVRVYGGIKVQRANHLITCDLSMEPIYSGSYYVRYRPFLFNFDTKRKYVLSRTICATTYFEEFFPTNIKEFEEFSRKLENPFSGEALHDAYGIDYYAVSQRVGEFLLLRELRSKEKRLQKRNLSITNEK